VPQSSERVFTYAAPGLKFGSGASGEIGWDVQQVTRRDDARVLLVTDPGVAATGHPTRIADALVERGLAVVTYDGAHVEPTDASLAAAVDFARDAGPFDAVVAVEGGSAIDTAKAVNLLLTNAGELMDYVNAPVGGGRAPEQPLLPLVAVPTTTGTGSESTTICVLDVLALQVKTGISHARLRPTLAVVDPDLTMTQPPLVTAACGMDILCHALESWTARPYTAFDAKTPEQRVPYCGANPIADMWAEKSLSLLAGSFVRAVRDGADAEARERMALAATFAGLGFGNAGVHVPHACAYPIAGRVRDYRPEGYPQDEPMVPHGMAVVMTAPAAFALTFEASPERHLRAAEILGFEARSARTSTSGGDSLVEVRGAPATSRETRDKDALPTVLRDLMQAVGLPSGLAELGYGEADVDGLVAGAMQQQRLLATAPVDVTPEDLAGVFRASMEHW
jgi:hydroxyacid-oxoacid transhydrogenase